MFLWRIAWETGNDRRFFAALTMTLLLVRKLVDRRKLKEDKTEKTQIAPNEIFNPPKLETSLHDGSRWESYLLRSRINRRRKRELPQPRRQVSETDGERMRANLTPLARFAATAEILDIGRGTKRSPTQ